MGSNSGLRDGDFDRLSIAVDLAVGDERNFGENGQVLISGGEGEELFWGSNSATLPQGLVAGSNITFNPAGTYNGSVETTISSTDTNTEYQGGVGISIDTATNPDTINCSNIPNSALANSTISGKALGTNLDSLTISQNGTIIDTFNGSTAKTINLEGKYSAGDGIEFSGHTIPVIEADTDEITISHNVGGAEKLQVLKVPNTLTITDSAGSSVVYDGSTAKSITINDNDTTYQGGVGISIDTATNPDTINCSNIPGSALAPDIDITTTGDLTLSSNTSVATFKGKVNIEGSSGLDFFKSGGATNTIRMVGETGNMLMSIGKLTLAKAGTTPAPTSATSGSYTDWAIDVSDTNGHVRVKGNIICDGTIFGAIDNDAITNVIAGDGIIVNSSGTERTIKTHIDEDTLNYKTGSPTKIVEVIKVPNKLKPGAGITMSGDYDGSAEITISSSDATTTETIVVQVNPTTDTSYAVYRRQLTDPRSLTEQFYIIDTNFNYEFSSPPVARYYKVDIQFVLSNSAINLPALAIEPVFLRLDKDDDGDNAWGIPQLVDIAYATGGTLQIKQASFILDFGSSFATLSVPEYPKIFPSMIQQSGGAVSPSAGRRATNENAIVVYGGAFFPQGLKMVLTPMGTDITTTTTGNPFSITGSDGISFVSNNIIQNPYISIATRVQEATKVFSAGTSYVEYSSDFRVSFIATSSNIIVEFRAIVRADNRLFYGGLYDYNASSFHTNTRTRFNYNDESDQDFTTITWILKGLTKGNTYYVSPYFRSNTSLVYIYAGHDNSTDGYAPAIMRIFDGGNDVSYVEPSGGGGV